MKRYIAINIQTTCSPETYDNQIFLKFAKKKQFKEADAAYRHAGMWGEWGIIAAVALNEVTFENDSYKVNQIYARYAEDLQGEENLLLDLFKFLNDTNDDIVLVGHNIVDFIKPVLCKRYLRHGIEIPANLKKEPLDIMLAMAFGSKNTMNLRSSAHLLCLDDDKAEMPNPSIYDLFVEQCPTKILKISSIESELTARVFGEMKILGGI